MSRYIDEFLPYNDKEVLEVMAEYEKGDEADSKITGKFYSKPVKVWNNEPEEGVVPNWNSFHWHVLFTEEQHEARVAAGTAGKDFMNCNVIYKTLKEGSVIEYKPRHTFGGRCRYSRARQIEVDIEIASIEAAKIIELEKNNN